MDERIWKPAQRCLGYSGEEMPALRENPRNGLQCGAWGEVVVEISVEEREG